jgi:L-ribulokinase
MKNFTLGVDYGTNSVRAIVVDCADGCEIASSVFDYPSGHQGILLDKRDPHLARQNPADYTAGLEASVRGAIAAALETGKYANLPDLAGFPAAAHGEKNTEFSPDRIVGIGVDTTGSTPIPVDAQNRPLALDPKWKDNLAAHAWLWKDHTSAVEADRITAAAREHRPGMVAKYGNTYSSEWFWSKVWHCLNVAPDVFDAAASWVEFGDYVPAVLAGVTKPGDIQRGVCMAGHKAMYSEEWGGLPDKEFLALLDPRLAALRDRLYEKAHDAGTPAGALCEEWAKRLGLRAGIPIAIGEMDAHYGAIGAGVAPGTLVKILGTSTCDCTVAPGTHTVADIPGICGIVNGSILPGHYGIEAGQSAVGDIFKWFVEVLCEGDAGNANPGNTGPGNAGPGNANLPIGNANRATQESGVPRGSGALHERLTREAEALRPGQSGLLALDWNNGNRTILVDTRLTGLLLGQTLHTTRAEVYRALIEATAFGARAIIERIREYGVPIERIVCCGGIADKNPMLMQIYADVTRCTMQIAGSSQACALGSAIAASVVAGVHKDFAAAQAAMTSVKAVQYVPDAKAAAVYDDLYALYHRLHDAFGGVEKAADLGGVMKDLLAIREKAAKAA